MQYILWIILAILLLMVIGYFFVGWATPAKHITWGVNFSEAGAEYLELDPQETYFAIIDDLGAKHIKLAVDWSAIETADEDYDFSSTDWYVKTAEAKGAKLILAIGMKTPRWPECHIPQWGLGLSEKEQQQQILEMLNKVVNRYKDSPALESWQVENEPLLNFGSCPWMDKDFLKQEIAYVKSLDSSHPIIVTDSGELSTWTRVGDVGADIVGVTTYRTIWQPALKSYFTYFFFPAVFYHRRAEIINWFYHVPVIGSELQAEPWCAQSVMNTSIAEQTKSMNTKRLADNVKFARATGFDTFYFWGGEWWYWMKTVHNDPSMWNAAKKVIGE